jgi:hypothetical protein
MNIETWSRLPRAVRDHLVERMHERNIGLEDLNQLRLWMESKPDVPDGLWYKEFGSFKLCGEGRYPIDVPSTGAIGHGAKALTRRQSGTGPAYSPDRNQARTRRPG